VEHELIVGAVVLVELRRILRDRFKVSRGAIDEIDALLREAVVVPKPRQHLGLRISDPDDEWIVASAVEGKAHVLVTGDVALLKIATRSPVPIVSPRGLWDLLRNRVER
jgi:putative PIN family toxin of toxin-antitoxin system